MRCKMRICEGDDGEQEKEEWWWTRKAWQGRRGRRWRIRRKIEEKCDNVVEEKGWKEGEGKEEDHEEGEEKKEGDEREREKEEEDKEKKMKREYD